MSINNRYLSTALGIVEPVHLVSLEDLAPDGVVRMEKEIEIYGVVRDMAVLETATDWEIQEQWGLYIPKTDKNASSGGPRVRMTQLSNGEVTYVLTTKTKKSNGNGECEEVSSAGMFEQFKLLAETGLRKKRYFFPIPGTDMKFEVDVFCGPNGTPIPHVKIDLEIHGDLADDFDLNTVKLPLEMSDIRIIAPGRKNDEDLAYVRRLFSEKYDIPNQYRTEPSMESGVKGICHDAFVNLLDDARPTKGDPVNAEDFPRVALTPEQEENAERWAVAKGESKAYLSEGEMSEELTRNKDAFVELGNQCMNLKGVLTYNEGKREATLKQQLCEVATTIQAIYTQPAE